MWSGRIVQEDQLTKDDGIRDGGSEARGVYGSIYRRANRMTWRDVRRNTEGGDITRQEWTRKGDPRRKDRIVKIV
jgi:hypothetical protein